MASRIKDALPSHLKPSSAEDGFGRHHGKTQSHMVSLHSNPPPGKQCVDSACVRIILETASRPATLNGLPAAAADGLRRMSLRASHRVASPPKPLNTISTRH